MLNWSLLNSDSRLVDEVLRNYSELVSSELSEHAYHDFLKKHAGFFLYNGVASYMALSKIKLGSDFEIDFAVPFEGYSSGLQWLLIEIEKPQDAPYTKAGVPSAALSRATQQVRDWKVWLQEHRSLAKQMFAVWGVRPERFPNFRFQVIIGTRNNSEKFLKLRDAYSKENGVEVRSFDYLMDLAKRRPFMDSCVVGSGNWDQDNIDLRKELANPFAEALTDSQWKKILSDPNVIEPHFTAHSCEAYLRERTINQDLLGRFREYANATQQVVEGDI